MFKIENIFSVYFEAISDLNESSIIMDNKNYKIDAKSDALNNHIAYVSLSYKCKKIISFDVAMDNIKTEKNNNGHINSIKFALHIDGTAYEFKVDSLNHLYESILTCLVNHIKSIDIDDNSLSVNKKQLFKELGLEKINKKNHLLILTQKVVF